MKIIGEDEIPFVKVPLNPDAFSKYNKQIDDEDIRL